MSESFSPTETGIFTQSDTFTQSFPFSNSNTFSDSMFFFATPTESIVGQTISNTASFMESFTRVKSVSLSMSYVSSQTIVMSYISELGEYSQILTQTYLQYRFPYIIQYYSKTMIPTVFLIEIPQNKARVTAEQMIGIVCGTIAAFFSILGIVILFIQKKNFGKKNKCSDLSILSSSEDEAMSHTNTNVTEKTQETQVTFDLDVINNTNIDLWM